LHTTRLSLRGVDTTLQIAIIRGPAHECYDGELRWTKTKRKGYVNQIGSIVSQSFGFGASTLGSLLLLIDYDQLYYTNPALGKYADMIVKDALCVGGVVPR
jgi:hypothetical protein